MRGTAGGFYTNMMRMYEYLEIPLHPIQFLFVFAEALSVPRLQLKASMKAFLDIFKASSDSYFLYSSNMHQTRLPWPGNRSVVAHIIETIYLIFCYLYFTAVCLLVKPRLNKTTRSRSEGGNEADINGERAETFAEYLQRTRMPRRYVSHYLLPIMSIVCTCSHTELLAFPASDVVTYKKLTQGQHHYTVCGGIHQVQRRLTTGITDIHLDAKVLKVEPQVGGSVKILWQSEAKGADSVNERIFDRVVMAVSPNVTARIFEPLADLLDKIPTVPVECTILDPTQNSSEVIQGFGEDAPSGGCSYHDGELSPSQLITFRTEISQYGSRTEALQAMCSGVLIRTCPLEPNAEPNNPLKTAKFIRTLRTAESRNVVQKIMGLDPPSRDNKRTDRNIPSWRNGENNVWLVGAWCWDGMVLLEGCVVSAMKVADDFGVRIPWSD